MPDLNEYVQSAIKTESKIDKIIVNEQLLKNTIDVLISAGNVLDQIKKHVFYNKEYDINKLQQLTLQLKLKSIDLDTYFTSKIVLDIEEEININPRVFHSIIGIATESTELLEALNLSGTDLDTINIGEEFGDITWYQAIGCDELNLNLNNILDTNILKLKTRYPEKFTNEDATIRDLQKERNILNKIKE